MSLIALIKNQDKPKLKANPVPVTELGEDAVVYVADLTAAESDTLGECWAKFRDKEMDGQSVVGYRAFCVAGCSCDKDRTLEATTYEQMVEAAKVLQELPNTVLSRLFNVANGANRFIGADEDFEKKLEEIQRKQTNVAGSGDTPATSDTQVALLG